MAAGSTYTPIATTTLGSAAASYTFSSIPSTYTDLIVAINPNTASVDNMNIRFNSDTGTNYSNTFLFGDGSSALSTRGTNRTTIAGTASGGWEIVRWNIMNYANTTTYKTVLNRMDDASTYTATNVGLWRSTAAINSVTIVAGTGNLPSGLMATLYGIAAA
jgi:hypothetical protein